MRVLVTGATGFLGSAITKACSAAGHTVIPVGRQAQPGILLPHYRSVDLLNRAALTSLLRGADCVVHAAGRAHQFKASRSDLSSFSSINVDGTITLIQAAADAKVPHVVLLSSVSVYGSSATNEAAACHPRGAYAQSKFLAEQGARELAAAQNLRLTILRLATCYGEGDPGNVQRLMKAIDRGRFIWIGNGGNLKSLIHRDDVARACLAVIEAHGTGISTYNVSAPPCFMHEIVDQLTVALGKSAPRIQIPASLVVAMARAGALLSLRRGWLGRLPMTVEKWLADDVYLATTFEQTFDFRTEVTLVEGLRREVAWYREQRH